MGVNLERAERILNAASQLIVHYGFDKTTVEDIAREAGISKGAVYLHYRSKHELLETLVIREAERATQEILNQIEADPEGGTLFGIYQHSVIAGLSNPLLRALYTHNSRVLGDFIRRWRDQGFDTQRYQMAMAFVKQLQDASILRSDLTPEMITYVLSIIRYGFLTVGEFLPASETPSPEETAKVIAEILQKGLAPAGGGDIEAGKRAFVELIEMARAMIATK